MSWVNVGGGGQGTAMRSSLVDLRRQPGEVWSLTTPTCSHAVIAFTAYKLACEEEKVEEEVEEEKEKKRRKGWWRNMGTDEKRRA